MKFVKRLLYTALGLAALLFAGGLLLSSDFRVSRDVVVQAPPEKLFDLVADPRQWKAWTVWNQRDPAMEVTYSGPDMGAGAGWSWHSKTEGDGKMTFTAAEPGKRLAYDLYFPDFGTTSTGELRFEPDGGGTRVTWVMNGNMGNNPIFRWMALFSDRMIGPDFEAGLKNLKALAEKA